MSHVIPKIVPPQVQASRGISRAERDDLHWYLDPKQNQPIPNRTPNFVNSSNIKAPGVISALPKLPSTPFASAQKTAHNLTQRPPQTQKQKQELQTDHMKQQVIKSHNFENFIEECETTVQSRLSHRFKKFPAPKPLVRGSSIGTYTTEDVTSVSPSEELKLLYEELDIMCNGPEPQAYMVKYYQSAIFELREMLKKRAIEFEKVLQDQIATLTRSKNPNVTFLIAFFEQNDFETQMTDLYWAAIHKLQSGGSTGAVKKWLRFEISKLPSNIIMQYGHIFEDGNLFD